MVSTSTDTVPYLVEVYVYGVVTRICVGSNQATHTEVVHGSGVTVVGPPNGNGGSTSTQGGIHCGLGSSSPSH